jgi:hypothetical protein
MVEREEHHLQQPTDARLDPPLANRRQPTRLCSLHRPAPLPDQPRHPLRPAHKIPSGPAEPRKQLPLTPER